MAGAFPTLKSGNTVFYPLVDTHSFGTDVVRFLDDSEQRWRTRLMLRRFKLTCNDINPYDSALMLKFFRSQFGKFDPTWSITFGGHTYPNCAFSSDDFKVTENKPNRHTLTFDVIQTLTDAPTIPGATPYFPQINSSGIITALPYQSALSSRTTSEDSAYTGKRYAWKWRVNPLGGFIINLQNLTTAEVTVLQNFFYSMEGRKGEFTFLDPGGNLVNYSDDFTNAAWHKSSITVGASVTDPFGGSLATSLTSSATSGLVYTTVIPAGNASGFVVTASVWAKAPAAGQSIAIGFLDNSLTNLGYIIWPLVQNVWRRVFCTITLATNNPIIVNIGGANTWGTSQVIQLFSASCAPLPGPGPRLLTPGMDGLRTYCRFDADDFTINYQDFGQTNISLPVMEYTH